MKKLTISQKGTIYLMRRGWNLEVPLNAPKQAILRAPGLAGHINYINRPRGTFMALNSRGLLTEVPTTEAGLTVYTLADGVAR